MQKMELTEDDQRELLAVLERYYPELRDEAANTDDREFRDFLKHKQEFVRNLMGRLQESARA